MEMEPPQNNAPAWLAGSDIGIPSPSFLSMPLMGLRDSLLLSWFSPKNTGFEFLVTLRRPGIGSQRLSLPSQRTSRSVVLELEAGDGTSWPQI